MGVIKLGGVPSPGDDVIRLGGKKKKPSKFKEKLTGFLTKTAVLEAGILGTLLGGPIGGLKAAGFTGLGLGILQTSVKARKFVTEKIKDPLAGGRFIGGLIEKEKQDDKTLVEKIKEGAKKAGIIGAVAAAGVGAAVVGKKVIEKVKKQKVPDVSAIIPQIPSASVIQPALQQLPVQIEQPQPFGVAEKVPVEEKAVPVAPTMPTINNRIKVAPEINISFRKSRRFINQQILMKQ